MRGGRSNSRGVKSGDHGNPHLSSHRGKPRRDPPGASFFERRFRLVLEQTPSQENPRRVCHICSTGRAPHGELGDGGLFHAGICGRVRDPSSSPNALIPSPYIACWAARKPITAMIDLYERRTAAVATTGHDSPVIEVRPRQDGLRRLLASFCHLEVRSECHPYSESLLDQRTRALRNTSLRKGPTPNSPPIAQTSPLLGLSNSNIVGVA